MNRLAAPGAEAPPRGDARPPRATGRQQRARVVVVGGGFAGLSAVRELARADVDVLLVDRAPYNTFQPLLYQVATGGLNPGDITYPLRTFVSRFPGVHFRRASIVGLDARRRRLHTHAGEEIAYDYLVICCGVTANYFGVPGAKEHARTIYSRKAAIDVRDTLFSTLEAVVQNLPGAVEPVVVIVGGGPTGVEMAGTLGELRQVALPRLYPELDIERVRILLVEMTNDVLGPFSPSLRAYTVRELEKRGVEVRLNTAVTEVHEEWVVLGDGEKVPSAATIWATGVTAPDYVSAWGLPQGRGGRIQVEPDLRVVGHPEIFAVGDVAAMVDGPLPQLAQPAIQGGRHAAAQIRRLVASQPTRPFRYRDLGIMATIGRSDAVVQLPFGLRLRGLIAWLAWVFLHIVRLMGHRNRLATLANLSVRYFGWSVSLNVILGDPRED